MKFSLTIEIQATREQPTKEAEPHPQGDNFASTERAGYQPVGFQVEMPNH